MSDNAVTAALQWLHRPAREAIEASEARLIRAMDASDREATIGSAKDYIETVAKAILDALGETYGSNTPLPSLTKQTLRALELEPAVIQGGNALRQLSSSMVGAAQAIAELRNTDGTGHGRATPSVLSWAHAVFIHDAALAWASWMLEIASTILADRARLDEALGDIGGARVFKGGQLSAYLDELHLPVLEEADQRRLGLAVARRWTVNDTFMPLSDVIEPIINGEADYPSAFYEGLIEGSLLDHNGYIKTTGADVERAVGVASRLPAKARPKLFDHLANRIAEAWPSHGFDHGHQQKAVKALRAQAGARPNASIRRALRRMADRLEAVDVEPAESASDV